MDWEPLNCIKVPTLAVAALDVALATGAVLPLEIVTVDGSLSTFPSLTTNWTT